MKVAIDARLVAGTNTGDSTYWTCQINAISQVHPEVQLLLFSNDPECVKVPVPANASWVYLPGKNARWWSLVAFPLAARKIADVTHVQYSLSPFAKNGVSTIHDISFMIGPEWFRPRDRIILQRSIPRTMRSAKRVITVSDTSRLEMERYFPYTQGKIVVTPNACPPWIQRHPNPAPILARLGIETPYALTVGTRWKRKNMELAITAMDSLPEGNPLKLVLTGKLAAEANELGSRGIATGYVDTDTLNALYTGAMMYLAPSFHEGFGIPILEAFRCGTPVICGPGGAMPEVAGDAAWVLPDYQVETWRDAIQSLSGSSPGGNQSKLSEMCEAGTQREKQFTWEDSARETVRAYREACQ